MSTCALAHHCRQGHVGRSADLGDLAVDLLGPDADIVRLSALIAGAAPADDEEARLARKLRHIADLLGLGSRAA